MTTCLDLLTNYQLDNRFIYLRSLLTAISALSGLYVMTAASTNRPGECRSHLLMNTLSNWIPHLKQETQDLTYSMFTGVCIGALAFRGAVFAFYLKGSQLKINFLVFYQQTSNRYERKISKISTLLTKYGNSSKQLSYLADKLEVNFVLNSTCLFWHKKTFELTDKIIIFMFVWSVAGGIAFNSLILILLEYLTLIPTNSNHSNLWLLVGDLTSYLDSECQVDLSSESRLILTIMIVTVFIDAITQATMISFIVICTAIITILWTIEIRHTLDVLVDERKRIEALGKNQQTRRANLFQSSWYIGSESLTLSQLFCLYSHSSLDGLCKSSDILQIDQGYAVSKKLFRDLSNSRSCDIIVEVLELVAQTEVRALIFSVLDINQFISLAVSVAALGGGMITFLSLHFYLTSPVSILVHNLALLAGTSMGLIILTLAIATASTANACLSSLDQQLCSILASTPSLSKERTVWDSIKLDWFGGTDRSKLSYTLINQSPVSWATYIEVKILWS